MSTRREFLQKASIVAFANAMSVDSVRAAEEKKEASTKAAPAAAKTGRSAVKRIRAATCRDDTLRRSGGSGMFPCITWSADDQQLLTVMEGAGWPGLPQDLYVEGALVAVSGKPENAEF